MQISRESWNGSKAKTVLCYTIVTGGMAPKEGSGYARTERIVARNGCSRSVDMWMVISDFQCEWSDSSGDDGKSRYPCKAVSGQFFLFSYFCVAIQVTSLFSSLQEKMWSLVNLFIYNFSINSLLYSMASVCQGTKNGSYMFRAAIYNNLKRYSSGCTGSNTFSVHHQFNTFIDNLFACSVKIWSQNRWLYLYIFIII